MFFYEVNLSEACDTSPDPGSTAVGSRAGATAKGDLSVCGQESNVAPPEVQVAIQSIDGQIAHGDALHDDRHPATSSSRTPRSCKHLANMRSKNGLKSAHVD